MVSSYKARSLQGQVQGKGRGGERRARETERTHTCWGERSKGRVPGGQSWDSGLGCPACRWHWGLLGTQAGTVSSSCEDLRRQHPERAHGPHLGARRRPALTVRDQGLSENKRPHRQRAASRRLAGVTPVWAPTPPSAPGCQWGTVTLEVQRAPPGSATSPTTPDPRRYHSCEKAETFLKTHLVCNKQNPN